MVDDAIYFTLTDKLTGDSNLVGFDLRVYESYQEYARGVWGDQLSGAYIFRPKAD